MIWLEEQRGPCSWYDKVLTSPLTAACAWRGRHHRLDGYTLPCNKTKPSLPEKLCLIHRFNNVKVSATFVLVNSSHSACLTARWNNMRYSMNSVSRINYVYCSLLCGLFFIAELFNLLTNTISNIDIMYFVKLSISLYSTCIIINYKHTMFMQ
jgi:hypothetical protein